MPPIEKNGMAGNQLADACDFLEHYHSNHTSDTITRLRGKATDIYIVSNREWREKLTEFTKDECPVPKKQ